MTEKDGVLYTVKQLAALAGVTVRTLHYYDEIGLLRPARVGENGYRYYDDAALLRLQQILLYREFGMELLQIKDILDSPDFDLIAALRAHREVLQDRITRTENLIRTVDETICHLEGEKPMSGKQLFGAFSEETQKQYEREARLQYDPQIVNDSIKRWNHYSQAEKDHILAEAGEIYRDMVEAIEAGRAPQSPEVQTILERWHKNIFHFYEPTLEILRGLGDGYNSDPAFIANFQKLHPDLPAYLQQGITQYVDDLETAEIERMLAEDEARNTRRLE
ncbi:MAG: MerR family transcriptional regulator [Chloroflexi bacterium OLB15]|nr:MAG: MerR family transcriptional regulator [Chloroflexi bacterium OLB15]